MNAQMNECTNKRMNAQTNKRMNAQTNAQAKHECTNTNGQTNECTN